MERNTVGLASMVDLLVCTCLLHNRVTQLFLHTVGQWLQDASPPCTYALSLHNFTAFSTKDLGEAQVSGGVGDQDLCTGLGTC